MKARLPFIATLINIGIALPSISAATSFYQSSSNELGFTEHPCHVTNPKSQEDLRQELSVARTDGSIRISMMGVYSPSRQVSGISITKTRDDVMRELRNMSANEKAARANSFTTN